MARSHAWKAVQCSCGPGDGAEVGDQAGDVAGHQVVKGLKGQGRLGLSPQGMRKLRKGFQEWRGVSCFCFIIVPLATGL